MKQAIKPLIVGAIAIVLLIVAHELGWFRANVKMTLAITDNQPLVVRHEPTATPTEVEQLKAELDKVNAEIHAVETLSGITMTEPDPTEWRYYIYYGTNLHIEVNNLDNPTTARITILDGLTSWTLVDGRAAR